MRRLRPWVAVIALLALAICADGSEATHPLRERTSGIPPTQSIHQLHHTTWRTANGAPMWPNGIVQDKQGLLWLSASNGMARFDGVSFDRTVGKRFDGRQVTTAFSDEQGDLWVGYLAGGVGRQHGEALTDTPAGSGLPQETVFAFAQTPDHVLWAAGADGVSRLVDRTWRKLGPEQGYDGRPLSQMVQSRDGSLWVGGAASYLVLRPGARRFVDVPRAQGDQELLGSPGTAFVSGPPTNALTMRDTAGSIWSGTQQGLTRTRFVADGNGDVRRVTEAFTSADGLSDNAVTLLFEGREGNVWVATAGGLDRFRQNKVTPVVFDRAILKPAIAVDHDNVAWIGSVWGGWQTTAEDAAQPAAVPALGRLISAMFVDAAGALWTGGQNGLQRTFHAVTETVALPPDLHGPNAPVQAIALDPSGDLWLSIAGYGLVERVGKAWVRDGGLAGLPDSLATQIVFDGKGRQWISYAEGTVVRVEHGKVQRFDQHAGLSIGTPVVLSLGPDTLWVGGSQGVARLVGERFVNLVPGCDGVLDGITGLLPRPGGDVWLHGNQGLLHVSQAEVAALQADAKHPVMADVFNEQDGISGSTDKMRPVPSLVAAPDGRLWVATGSGVSWIDPNDVPRNTVAPIPVIDSVVVDGQNYPGHGVLRLPQDTTNARINFTAGSLTVPELVRFEHRLDGVDSQWQVGYGRRDAEYPDLRHGRHVFHLRVTNEDDVRGTTEAVVELDIPPRFYATWWFVFVCVLFGALVIWLIYARHVRRLLDLMRATSLERERIARELHDTLLQSVQGLLLLILATARDLRDPMTRDRLLRAAEAVRATVVESRDQVQSLRGNGEDIDLPTSLAQVATMLQVPYPVHFTLSVEGRSVPVDCSVAQELLPVLREMLTNAFRHAKATRIHLQLHYGMWHLSGAVIDDGTGMTPEVLKLGERAGHWGLPGMRERTHQLHGKFELTSRPGHGTTVRVSIPARQIYRECLIFRLLRRRHGSQARNV